MPVLSHICCLVSWVVVIESSPLLQYCSNHVQHLIGFLKQLLIFVWCIGGKHWFQSAFGLWLEAKTMASAEQTFDEYFKILVIGDSDVGKTSLVFRFVDGSFSSQFVPTVGMDFKNKTIVWNYKRIQLQIWDTGEFSFICWKLRWTVDQFLILTLSFCVLAGQERYRSLTTAYYRGAAGFIIVYDITNEISFKDVQEW